MKPGKYDHLPKLLRLEREFADLKSDVDIAECNLEELRTALAEKEEEYAEACHKSCLSAQDAAEMLLMVERR